MTSTNRGSKGHGLCLQDYVISQIFQDPGTLTNQKFIFMYLLFQFHGVYLLKSFFLLVIINWLVLSDEQMSKGLPFFLLNDEQMSNWLGVEHQPVKDPNGKLQEPKLTLIHIWYDSKTGVSRKNECS